MAKSNKARSASNGGANLGFEATLATLRDTLLPKLISGELRIKDAERLAEKAL